MVRKGKNSSKKDEKYGTQASDADKAPDVLTSESNETGVSQKLDTLLEAVKQMGEELK